jgi:hypothetical protein
LCQLESSDLKPDAPAENRGVFRQMAIFAQTFRRPKNLAATTYQTLGLPATVAWRETRDRPHYVYRGNPITSLF